LINDLITVHAPFTYISNEFVDVFKRVIPVAPVGRCAVVPTGTVNAPVELTVTTPETGVSVRLPVVSPVLTSAVVAVVPAEIVLI
jgi:hypothetical protein